MSEWNYQHFRRIQDEIIRFLKLEIAPDDHLEQLDELIQRREVMLQGLGQDLEAISNAERRNYRKHLTNMVEQEVRIQQLMENRMERVLDKAYSIVRRRRTLNNYSHRPLRHARYLDRNV